MSHFLLFRQLLENRLARPALRWFRDASREIAEVVPDARFCTLLSLASRHAGHAPLAPTAAEAERIDLAVTGVNAEWWSLLDTLRVALVLARDDLGEESAVLAVEEAFRFADEGEAVALHRALALLPDPGRFVWRAGEGCRSNMRSVFEAAALDTPVPATCFDDGAWRQAVVKCLFVGAPLWRMWGLDDRLSEELARIVLDLADERRSAGRPVPHDLWLCLGTHGGDRALDSLEAELDPANPHTRGRRGAAYGLARAGRINRLEVRASAEEDPVVQGAIRDALAGHTAATHFRNLDPNS